jgi:hypothetical protein
MMGRLMLAENANAHVAFRQIMLLEPQRNWARGETYDAVVNVAKDLGGAYGLGLIYAKTMLGEHASEASTSARVAV